MDYEYIVLGTLWWAGHHTASHPRVPVILKRGRRESLSPPPYTGHHSAASVGSVFFWGRAPCLGPSLGHSNNRTASAAQLSSLPPSPRWKLNSAVHWNVTLLPGGWQPCAEFGKSRVYVSTRSILLLRDLSWFSLVPACKFRNSNSDQPPPVAVTRFIIHQSSYHSTLRSLSY
jgi:hypothetical protein